MKKKKKEHKVNNKIIIAFSLKSHSRNHPMGGASGSQREGEEAGNDSSKKNV